LLQNVCAWQERNDDAQAHNQQVLDQLLHDLDTDQQQLMEKLSELDEQTLNYLTEFTIPRCQPVQCHGNNGVTAAPH
jgi:hypothetical protein